MLQYCSTCQIGCTHIVFWRAREIHLINRKKYILLSKKREIPMSSTVAILLNLHIYVFWRAHPTVTLSTCNCQFPQTQLSSPPTNCSSCCSFQPIRSSAACSRPIRAQLAAILPWSCGRTKKLVGQREVEVEVAGGSLEDAADDGSGAWLPGRPLPLRHRRDRPPDAQRSEQPRQQQDGKTSERKKTRIWILNQEVKVISK